MTIPPVWKKLPVILVVVGAIGAAAGIFAPSLTKQFAYSYLLAYMFFLSLCLGGMFMTIIHHLFDAAWSVPLRRINEHLAFLTPVMGVLFIPIAIWGPTELYSWMKLDPHVDHSLGAKHPLFTRAGFYISAIAVFAVWTWLSFNLRKWSIKQDHAGKDNALRVLCTRKMRVHAAYGVYAFAFSLTLGAIMWMKALEHQWFSTMYGVYYFAGAVWTTLAVLYIIITVLQKAGPLDKVITKKQRQDTAVLWLAFTVFYAYIHFSQYFLIYNANIPEETFYYVKREAGSWWQVGMVTIFGHFLIPFVALLNQDTKQKLALMIPLALWALVMHFCDMSFNIMPLIHPAGFVVHWLDITCMAFIGGVLAIVFIKYFNAHKPYPVNDPRLGEALGVHQYEDHK